MTRGASIREACAAISLAGLLGACGGSAPTPPGALDDGAVDGTVDDVATPPGQGPLHDGALDPDRFTLVGDRAFFTASSAEHGRELWVTDGTRAGTYQVKDILPGPGDSSLAALAAFDGQLFFSASDGTAFGGLWISDGTEAGTRLVKDISTSGSESITFVAAAGGRVYFTARTPAHGRELWMTDGTTLGTQLVADINPGSGDSLVDQAVAWNGKLFLYAYDGAYTQLCVVEGAGFAELTNSTYPGTVLLDYDMMVYKDRLYFTWHSQANGIELWRTDGTTGNTQLFLDLDPRTQTWPLDGRPNRFHLLGEQLVFFAKEGNYMSLWSTDGSSAGTHIIGHVEPGPTMDAMVAMNGHYYFSGRAHGQNAFRLWATDGTEDGTFEVSSVRPDDWYQSRKMVSLGDRLVFMGTDGVHGFEPWVTDGTAGGTHMLANVHATEGSYPATVGAGWIAVRRNTAVFVAAAATDDFQLYQTDGTLGGTGIVTPPNATVTVNPMGHEGFSGMLPNAVPTLVGDTFVFRGGFQPGPHLLFQM